jgi:hypothetical protein
MHCIHPGEPFNDVLNGVFFGFELRRRAACTIYLGEGPKSPTALTGKPYESFSSTNFLGFLRERGKASLRVARERGESHEIGADREEIAHTVQTSRQMITRLLRTLRGNEY